jgi:hypothetical protein
MHNLLPAAQEKALSVESILYQFPLDAKMVMIQVKIKRHNTVTEVKFLMHDKLIQMDGGKKALKEYLSLYQNRNPHTLALKE